MITRVWAAANTTRLLADIRGVYAADQEQLAAVEDGSGMMLLASRLGRCAASRAGSVYHIVGTARPQRNGQLLL
jgi:hypothetical protein